MALTGTINGTTNSTLVRVKVDWTQVQNVAANTSTVTFKLYARRTDRSTAYFEGRGTWYLHTNNTKLTGKTATVKLQATSDGQGIWTLIGTWSKTFTHTSAGTCTVKVQATGGYTYSGAYYTSTTLGTTIQLEPIFRDVASTIELDQDQMTVDGTAAVSCTITRVNPAAFHRILYYMQGHSAEAQEVDPQQSELTVGITLPETWWAQIGSVADGGTAVFELLTYSDAERTQQIGTSDSATLTVFLPANAGGPVVSEGWYEIAPNGGSAAVAGWGVYIQGVTTCLCTFDTSKILPRGGYEVVQTHIRYRGNWYGTETPVLQAGTYEITIEAIDERGAVTQAREWITVLAYQSPQINGQRAVRCNNQGQEDPAGTFVLTVAGAVVSGLGGLNTYTLTVQTKPATGNWRTPVTVTSMQPQVLNMINADNTYTVRWTLTDAVGNSTERTAEIGRAAGYYLGFHMTPYGTGAAFGQKCEADGWLQVNYAGGVELIHGVLKIGGTTLNEQQLQALLALISGS